MFSTLFSFKVADRKEDMLWVMPRPSRCKTEIGETEFRRILVKRLATSRMRSEPYHLVKTMEQRADGSWTNPVLHADPAPLLGKRLVVAIRYPEGGSEALIHFYGPIARITEEGGIVITRADTGREFAIPPRAYLVEENQRATRPTSMTQVIRPDYSTLIKLSSAPREYGWNPQRDRHGVDENVA